jgi:hypothetical protein
MTRVIVASTLFGYGVVLSDVCVTCRESGRRMDCLQKAFPLGKYIIGGFAGDVEVGFILLDSLRRFLSDMRPAHDECCEPEYIAEEWAPVARRLHEQATSPREAFGSQIMMVGVSPRENTLGDAVAVVSTFRSPELVPETVIGGNRAVSIGSGADVEGYRQALEHTINDPGLVYMQAEVGSPGGYARAIAGMISREIRLNPIDGISQHFHLFLVRPGRIEGMASGGMPDVARSRPELLTRLDGQADGYALNAAIKPC